MVKQVGNQQQSLKKNMLRVRVRTSLLQKPHRLPVLIGTGPHVGNSVSALPAGLSLSVELTAPAVLLKLTAASEILPSITGGWQTGRRGHREKGTCLLRLTTVSIQAV